MRRVWLIPKINPSTAHALNNTFSPSSGIVDFPFSKVFIRLPANKIKGTFMISTTIRHSMKTTFTTTLPVKVFLVISTLLVLNKKGFAQDNCSNAITLSTGNSCSLYASRLQNMTPSTGSPAGEWSAPISGSRPHRKASTPSGGSPSSTGFKAT